MLSNLSFPEEIVTSGTVPIGLRASVGPTWCSSPEQAWSDWQTRGINQHRINTGATSGILTQ